MMTRRPDTTRVCTSNDCTYFLDIFQKVLYIALYSYSYRIRSRKKKKNLCCCCFDSLYGSGGVGLISIEMERVGGMISQDSTRRIGNNQTFFRNLLLLFLFLFCPFVEMMLHDVIGWSHYS